MRDTPRESVPDHTVGRRPNLASAVFEAGPRSARFQLTRAAIRRYCENMKNITVTVDDDTYRRARIKAAERDTSVSALVKQFLTELATEESDPERLLRQERDLRARVTNFSASDRLPRDELHDRRR